MAKRDFFDGHEHEVADPYNGPLECMHCGASCGCCHGCDEFLFLDGDGICEDCANEAMLDEGEL